MEQGSNFGLCGGGHDVLEYVGDGVDGDIFGGEGYFAEIRGLA